MSALALSYAFEGKLPDCKRQYEDVRRQGDLDDPFILYMIGLSYEAKGDTSNAKEYYRRTMASNVYSLQSAIARPQARAKLSGTSK